MSSIILKNLYKEDKIIPLLIRNNVVLYKMAVKPIFVLSVNSIKMITGETTSFTITANDKWTITAPEEVVLSSYSGYGNATITLTGNSECQGLISVTCEGVTKTISITVETKTDFSTIYLTFKITSAGNIKWSATNTGITRQISYSRDNGTSWIEITSSYSTPPSISVNAGDTIMFKGTNNTYANSAYYSGFRTSTAGFEVEGNIMSLIYGDDFKNKTSFQSGSNYNLDELFRDCTGLTSAENLILPVTTLTQGCYRSMFIGCSSLTSAPTLSATTLVNDCYTFMFLNCSSLNYIKCLATNWERSYTGSWVSGVSSTGTFVKAAGVSWSTGVSGIPNGWTVEEV